MVGRGDLPEDVPDREQPAEAVPAGGLHREDLLLLAAEDQDGHAERRLDPAQPGVVTVGMVQAGSAPNIIPEGALLRGTVRATIAKRLLEAEGMNAARKVNTPMNATAPPTRNSPPVRMVVRLVILTFRCA